MDNRKVILTPKEAYELGRTKGLAELKAFHVSDNFTWAEVFAKETEADFRTATITIFQNALKQAMTMEVVRRVFGGRPITVINWYRSPDHNARVKGANNSFHKVGLATDFTVQGYTGIAGNKAVQKTLDKHPSFQKHGLEFTGGNWTHVDSRGYRERFYS